MVEHEVDGFHVIEGQRGIRQVLWVWTDHHTVGGRVLQVVETTGNVETKRLVESLPE
jgi:hypothetical protein